MTAIHQLQEGSVELLKQLISIPSFSRVEGETALVIEQFLVNKGVKTNRYINNVFAVNKFFDPSKPTLLLNSHHDTVKPNSGWTLDPFAATQSEGKLYGLGSNDAGASLVALIAAFLYFYEKENLRYNLILAATAEEEISGHNGIEALLPQLPTIDCAIVGEPTQMQMAVAERGLLVLDCTATGKAGHAAREEGDNALYKAMEDITKLRQMEFERKSQLLGEVKLTVTSIETSNKAHNIVPGECRFIVDVRVNEMYSLEEVLEKIRVSIHSDVKARSTRIRSTSIVLGHPLVKAGISLGKSYYGSPTTSDKALMPFPALKMGPGDSARSHTADEYIFIDEIHKGVADYIQFLNKLL